MLQEELPVLPKEYEKRGYFDEVVSLLEAGSSLERAHVSIRALCRHDRSRRVPDGYLHRAIRLVQQV